MIKHRSVYLYAFDREHNLVDVKFLMDEAINIRGIQSTARFMRIRTPNVYEIVVLDNSRDLKEAYRELLASKNAFTMKIEFWDYIVRDGLVVFRKD